MLETVELDSNVGSRGPTNEKLLCECEDGPFGWSLRARTVASPMFQECGGLDLAWAGELRLPS